MRFKRMGYVMVLIVITLLMAANTGVEIYAVPALPPNVPTPNAPDGNLRDRTPYFTWTAEAGATEYQFEVFLGIDRVYTEDVGASYCSSTFCAYLPATVLNYAGYAWRVRAGNGSEWSAWSAFKSFTIQAPIPKMPSGTIVDTTPRYVWTKEYGANQYRIQLLQGSTIIYTKTISSPSCGATNCLYTPSDVLPLGSYKWRLRVYADSVWGAWTAAKTFKIIKDPSFYSTFSGDMTGWKKIDGVWGIHANVFLKTRGVDDVLASIYYTDANFADMRYTVKMKRAGTDCTTCATGIYIRGAIQPLGATYHFWDKGYFFGYSNAGQFVIYKLDGGFSALKGWTGSTAINQGGWNQLRVDAKGDFLNFYINNTLVWSGTDSTHSIGKVGIAFFQSSYPGDLLVVDWAKTTFWVFLPSCH